MLATCWELLVAWWCDYSYKAITYITLGSLDLEALEVERWPFSSS